MSERDRLDSPTASLAKGQQASNALNGNKNLDWNKPLWNTNLIPVQLVKNAQYVQEQVQYIHVQVDGGQDVLLRGEDGHHLVCVEDKEQAEEDGSGEREGHLEGWTLEEDLQDASHNEHTEACSEAVSEINFILNVEWPIETAGTVVFHLCWIYTLSLTA